MAQAADTATTEATEATQQEQEQTEAVATEATDATVTTKTEENKGLESTTVTTEEKTVTEEKKESIYNSPMPARIEVGNGYRYNRPLNFYVDRARRILRTEKTLEVTGHGTS